MVELLKITELFIGVFSSRVPDAGNPFFSSNSIGSFEKQIGIPEKLRN